jgi:hypothetical protein
MSVRRSTLSGTSTWQRRAVVLVTALASALGVAVVAGPAADAARPTPPPATAQLQFTKVLDNAFTLPDAAAPGTQEGLIRSGLPFNVEVQSRTADGTAPLVVTNGDLKVTLSGGGVSGLLVIERGQDTGTLSGLVRTANSNFSLSATGPKNSGYASDTIPVHVALESAQSNGLAGGQTLNVKDAAGNDCVLSAGNPTCVSLSVDGGAAGSVVLTTRECAGFLGVQECRTKKGNTVLVAQTLVDLALGQVATATLFCDKSLCGQGGVSSYIPLFDKGNDGVFTRLAECPAKGALGEAGSLAEHACVDLRSSTRFNAGDLATVILFDDDARSLH